MTPDVARSTSGRSDHRRPRVWAVLAVLLVGFGVVACSDDGDELLCGGQQFDGPVEATPEAAMRSWLSDHPNEPPLSAWTMSEGRGEGRPSFTFESDESTNWISVQVRSVPPARAASDEPAADGGWQVFGSCGRIEEF